MSKAIQCLNPPALVRRDAIVQGALDVVAAISASVCPATAARALIESALDLTTGAASGDPSDLVVPRRRELLCPRTQHHSFMDR